MVSKKALDYVHYILAPSSMLFLCLIGLAGKLAMGYFERLSIYYLAENGEILAASFSPGKLKLFHRSTLILLPCTYENEIFSLPWEKRPN